MRLLLGFCPRCKVTAAIPLEHYDDDKLMGLTWVEPLPADGGLCPECSSVLAIWDAATYPDRTWGD